MFVKSELKAKLVQQEMNVESLAERLKKNPSTLYRKISDGNFDIEEVDAIRDILELSDDDVISIFFARDVS